MADHGLITRRAELVGAIASTAALTAPIALAIESRTTSLRDLIEIHKAAFGAHNDACGEFMAIEDKLPWLKLQFSVNRSTDQPIYAFSRATIEEKMEQCLSIAKHFGAKSIQNTERLWLGKLAEWDQLEANRARLATELGLELADQRQTETMHAEEAARLAIVLHRPRDADEEALKRKYWQESPPFHDGWCHNEDEFVEAVYEALCVAKSA